MSLPRWMRPTLLLIGLFFLLAAAAAVGLGMGAAGWLRATLPGVRADASVIGGAAVAFGAGLALLGSGQVALGLLLDRPSRAVRAAAVVGGLVAAMASLVGLTTVAVSIAREAAAAPLLWAAVPVLAAATAIYLVLAVGMLRTARR